jgi:hypothetical protein
MSSENDVPLNDPARYYEKQFGDRVRNVAKPGARGPSPSSGGGRGWWGGGGAAIFGIIIIVRLLLSLGGSSRPSYNYQPPPQFHFDQKKLDDILRNKEKDWRLPDGDPNVFPPDVNQNDPAREKKK